MSHELDLFLREGGRALEAELKRCIPVSSLKGSKKLNQAVHDALFPGGKRMRPLLTLLATHTAAGSWRNALLAACAVEYLHTCSLILEFARHISQPVIDRARECLGSEATEIRES